jgi:hypothetical protein
MAQGKPIFEPSDQTLPEDNLTEQGAEGMTPPLPGEASQTRPEKPESGIHKNDSRTFPAVIIKRCDCHVRGSDMELYGHISNESPMPIKLDRIRLFGSQERLEVDLHPHEERQVRIYQGPQRASQNEHEAILDYRTEDGDYFEATHDIRFAYHPDTKSYSIDEMHLRPPIRDIYG